MVRAIDVAKPVIVTALVGLFANVLYNATRLDLTPYAFATLFSTIVTLAALVKRSRTLARAARVAFAAIATWILADTAARLGLPPYLLFATAPLFYRFVYVAASLTGGMFGASMGPAIVLAAPIVSALDVLMVYRTRLYFASVTLNDTVVELAAKFKSFTLGMADFMWYAAAVAAAGPAKAPLAAVAIYAGLLATTRIVQRRGYAPALPIPLFFAQLVLLAPTPHFF